ncbi:class-I glutamine amidotransferase, partial [Helicosporidium sp. ATCC 50920]
MSSKCLLIDNYDSYTYNLYQIVAHVLGEAPDVIFNDGVAWQDLRKRLEAGEYGSIVISPGPGNPNTPSDVGILTDLFQADLGIPILGVCMGMQSLALSYGARVSRAPVPVHGRRSSIEHSGGPLFAGIPSGLGYSVVRYHSLAVEASSLPSSLLPTAWTVPMEGLPSQTRLLMGLRHAERPYWGVQYHPESVESEFGVQLLHNFLSLAAAHAGAASPRALAPAECRPPCGRPHEGQARDPPYESDERGLRLAVRHSQPGALERAGGAERLFSTLVLGETSAEPASSAPTKQDCWWLDSASEDRGRFSFMGGRGGRLWRRVTYRTGASEGKADGKATVETADGATQTSNTTFFPWLEATMREMRLCPQALRDSAALEFDFCGGLVGYLGYELRHELGSRVRHPATTPDAALFLADQ